MVEDWLIAPCDWGQDRNVHFNYLYQHCTEDPSLLSKQNKQNYKYTRKNVQLYILEDYIMSVKNFNDQPKIFFKLQDLTFKYNKIGG